MDPKISMASFQARTLDLMNQMYRIRESGAGKGLRTESSNSPESKKIATEFESMFINLLLKEMRASLPKPGMLGHSPSAEIYTAMFDAQIAQDISTKGGIGLAHMLEGQLDQSCRDEK
jgi:flagellar protein FlgJ